MYGVSQIQHTVYKSGILSLSQEGCFLEAGGQGTTTSVFLTYLGIMLSPVRNSVILQCFDTVGWVTGRESSHNNSQCLVLGTGQA